MFLPVIFGVIPPDYQGITVSENPVETSYKGGPTIYAAFNRSANIGPSSRKFTPYFLSNVLRPFCPSSLW